MNSTRLVLAAAIAAFLAGIAAPAESAQLFQERTYQDKPVTYWLQVIRDRDEELIALAFDAVHSLGDDAWIAVPELTRFVAAPFSPIRVGKDSHEAIASKLIDIALRGEAVETLSWIGELAAPATTTLIGWALVRRVDAGTAGSKDDDQLFVDLVAMDAEERMRAARAVSHLGTATFPAVAELLSSTDAAKRKLAVAILSVDSLAIAAEMLHSSICDDRMLGLEILKDMDLIVSQAHIDRLAIQVRENCLTLSKQMSSQPRGHAEYSAHSR